MRELNNNELMEIVGGAWYSASFFNAVSRAVDTLMNVGRSLGSAIRRAFNGTVCPV